MSRTQYRVGNLGVWGGAPARGLAVNAVNRGEPVVVAR